MSSCCERSHNSKWMNPKAKGKEAYKPTQIEHYANFFTHAAVILPSVLCVCHMLSYCRSHAQYKSSLIYGCSLVMLFTMSTLFHAVSCSSKLSRSLWKTFFHYCDRGTIYLFIASSYTPWLYLRAPSTLIGEYMLAIVWLSAILGVIYQIVFHEKYKLLEVFFYMAIGICPSIVVIDMADCSGITELAIGGALYVTGVLFFKSDGVIPFAHAIWHIFVGLAAFIHYYAIFTYLIKEEHLIMK